MRSGYRVVRPIPAAADSSTTSSGGARQAVSRTNASRRPRNPRAPAPRSSNRTVECRAEQADDGGVDAAHSGLGLPGARNAPERQRAHQRQQSPGRKIATRATRAPATPAGGEPAAAPR